MRWLTNFNLGACRYLILILIGVPIFLTIDSPYGDRVFGDGQVVASLLVFLAFIYSFTGSNQRNKHVMLVGMLVGLVGEYLFSIVFGMYHYRFENIPIWLAFGHGLIFSVVYKMSTNAGIKKNHVVIKKILLLFVVFYSTAWLIWANDLYGFLCTCVFIIVLSAAKKSRLFFLIMFAVVCYIELIGTATECWYWPEVAFSSMTWLPSANPPSGIAVFYFLFDTAVFYIYLHILHPKTKERFQNIRSDS